MALPLITLQLDNNMYGFPETGNLSYSYSPFQNLQNPNPLIGNALLGLSINSQIAGINITKPVSIETEVSYDDSVNLIISDTINPPKIVNSRFYQTSTMTYAIADRKGNLDTNIYSEKNFKIESGFIKSVKTISTIDFLGIKDGGIMKVGNYTFYFKLADADGNETDFIAESGKLVCHIGVVNSPKSIRGGLLDENSYKLIKFRLNNLDLAYDYINIYYTRSSGNEDSDIIWTYKITDKFKITNNDVSISITGYEHHEEIALSDINIQYTNFDSVESLANCQNITFAGNITNDYNLFKTLEKYSLLITPQIEFDEAGIGNLDSLYNESYLNNGYEYYNVNNIYYKLGLWDEEIYRYGIVYILNNFTLSPVFNTRGKKSLGLNTIFQSFNLTDNINYGEDYLIEGSSFTNPENTKGVFKIDTETRLMFDNTQSIKPIGIKFNFTNNVLDGDGLFLDGLKQLTKGFFIVRQKRIPTILAQGIGIATSTKSKIPVIKGIKVFPETPEFNLNLNYFSQSFLSMVGANPVLKASLFPISEVKNNALLCPEASIRRTVFNTFFNSSEYTLKPSKYNSITPVFGSPNPLTNAFSIRSLSPVLTPILSINTELTLIEPGIELIRNNIYEFSSRGGNELIPYKFTDPVLGNYEDPANDVPVVPPATEPNWNGTATKVRGEFNTYVGCSVNSIEHARYYNIFQKNYNFESYWKEYFLIRYNDSSPFLPVSNRIDWNLLKTTNLGPVKTYTSQGFYRGDCYINTYTQRMNWNFIDSDLPTNKRIVDKYTWAKNIKIKKGISTIVRDDEGNPDTLTYNKLLLLFTYKHSNDNSHLWANFTTEQEDTIPTGLLESDAKKFKRYSERNGLFGAEKVNKPDINAVPLGHWVTFKICSNVNLAMRDLDFSRPQEEAIHKIKRGFYPLQAMDPKNHLPESDVLNMGISKSLGDKYYFEIPNIPFIKTNFATRIYYSNLLQNSSFTNGNRVFESSNFLDYTREYGSLIKLIEWYGKLIAVMEHGVLMIPINERAMMKNEEGENVYINTSTVLPQNPKVLSNTFGSLWAESVIKTARYIYGIDTVGKKVWRTNGETFENISDIKIQKFLNDHINLRESDKDKSVNINFVKTHYNAFKQDVLFTFKYNEVAWNLCWNELTNKWVTQYTWFPEFSENINNIFYTFANQSKHTLAQNKLFKHGFAGMIEEAGNILPTTWYSEQHPFEYEFVVTGIPGIQKIFNNLKIISNLTEPDSFYYEVVGEGFDWYKYKSIIIDINKTVSKYSSGTTLKTLAVLIEDVKIAYSTYLATHSNITKLPFIVIQSFDVNEEVNWFKNTTIVNNNAIMDTLKELTLREYTKTREKLVNSYQKGWNIKKYGRMKGNMQYLEDSWNVQVQPINFKYAYLKSGVLTFTPNVEMKIRDKYIKVRIKYTGKEYAVINAIRTLYTISYA